MSTTQLAVVILKCAIFLKKINTLFASKAPHVRL